MKKIMFGIIFCCLPLTAFATLKSVMVMHFHGIQCQYCTYTMQYNLNKLAEVEQVAVSNNTLRLISKSANPLNAEQIQKIIYQAGYIPSDPLFFQTDD